MPISKYLNVLLAVMDPNTILSLLFYRNLVQRDRFARSVEPLCILYFKSRGTHQWKEVGRTERLLNTLSPEWSQTMVLDYIFEEKQVSSTYVGTYLFT